VKNLKKRICAVLATSVSVPLVAGLVFVLGAPADPPPKTYTDVTASPYGAVPDDGQDDSAAFQSALNDLKAAGGGSLYIPNGSYRFDSIVTVTNSDWGLTLRGQSTNARLYSNNTNGIFRLTHTSRKEEITLRDFSLIATLPGAGTAIEVTSPQGGVADKRIVTADNLSFRFFGATNYFNRGLVVTGVYRPLISRCSFSGPVDEADLSDTSLSFKTQTAFDVSDCYAPVIEQCSVSGVDTAYYFVASSNAVPEDGAIRSSSADDCKTGIRFQMADGVVEPTLWITDCNITARDTGAWITGRRILHITGSTFQQLSAAHPLTDIQLDNVHLGVVLGNAFAGDLSGGRKNVRIDADGLDLLFAENTWSGTPEESVQIDAAAEDVYVY
jgi:hypothetical protein